MPTAAFITLGCKINHYETEAFREEVLALGYRETEASEAADVYVVNACAVTEESSANSRKAVLRAARRNAAARIIVVGCSTAAERQRIAAIPQVVFLAGNEEKAMVADFLAGGWRPGEGFPRAERRLIDMSIARHDGRTRAVVKVQDGCDGFCSFCIIPFLRGRSRSRPPEDVRAELERLAAAGFLEVVLTGVHIQDYGADLEPPVRLDELLRRAARVRGIERLRLSSIGVRAFTPAVLDALRDPVFCPHWHIPLQSGSDRVLERMRRDYRLEDLRRLVAALRRRGDDPAFSTDVIAGHPGEDPAAFAETVAACRELGFAKLHVFPYSRREGTLATKLPGQVDPLEVRRRAGELLRLDRELGTRHREGRVGAVLDDVLVEGLPAARAAAEAGRDAPPELEGFTRRYDRVRFAAPSPQAARRFPGTVQTVRIVRAEAGALRGEWAGELSPVPSFEAGIAP